MIETPIHLIDFEGNRQSGIVEYGVATLQGQHLVSTDTGLCRSSGTISDFERSQHRIDERSLEDCAPFASQWELFSGLRKTGVFCAHNASVEDGLLRAVWPCPSTSPDFFSLGNASKLSWGPWLDTLWVYRRVYPNLESYHLELLIDLFGLQTKLDDLAQASCPEGRRQYHSALYDAMASALLLVRIFEEPDFETISLHWLLRQSRGSEADRAAAGQQEFTLE
ncbi:MAG: 3'-5' exonuclease [Coraliomargaritaceae bacterium]